MTHTKSADIETANPDANNPASENKASKKISIFGLDRAAMTEWFAGIGEKPFRAKQVMSWIYGQGVTDFSAMTDLSKSLRQKLTDIAVVDTPQVRYDKTSKDGTRKWLFQVANNKNIVSAEQNETGFSASSSAIETVYIPEKSRGTLCISSQVGCTLDCTFCSTAQQGFNRNLSTAEIIGQVWLANQLLGPRPNGDRSVTNVVLMGMGEPLANFNKVLPAINIMLDDFGFGYSKRRVTLSTSGIVPMIDRLHEQCDVALAVSLHAPTDDLRNQLVPINHKYPIAELMGACDRYLDGKANRATITYEYVMIDGVNDGVEQARGLVKLLKSRQAKVNMIPFNPFPGTAFKRSKPENIERFKQYLNNHGIMATVRRTRGDDIDAACGQLVGQVLNKKRSAASATPRSNASAGADDTVNAGKPARFIDL